MNPSIKDLHFALACILEENRGSVTVSKKSMDMCRTHNQIITTTNSDGSVTFQLILRPDLVN